VTPEWVSQRYKRWGPENPLYLSRVKAEFPTEGEDTLIPMSHIEAAKKRTLEPTDNPNVIGVDVARFGTDFSVIAHRRGPVIRILQRFGKTDTMTTTGHARRHRRLTKATRAIVDADGLGAGVADRLREQREPVKDAHGGASPSDKDMFLNQRAEWYWNLRIAFETGEIDIDPADEDLAAQLSDMKWKVNSSGKIVLEPKEEMKKRLGCSPDDADAVAMTFGEDLKYLDKLKKSFEKGF